MASTIRTAQEPTEKPLYRVLVVYENEKNPEDIEELQNFINSRKLKEQTSYHPIKFEVSILDKVNPVDALLYDQPSTRKSERTVSPQVSDFIRYVKDKIDSDQGEPLPVIIIALGFAALVAMKAVMWEHKRGGKIVPMGMILASVSEKTATGMSGQFQNWYGKMSKEEDDSKERRLKFEQEISTQKIDGLRKNLTEQDVLLKTEREVIEKWLSDREDSALSSLKSVLRDFDKFCRRERIRLSYVFRNKEHDFVRDNLRYGRPYQEDENFSLEHILQDHIERSWPEQLLQLVRANNADSDREAWRLIKKHKVEHCHEPIIAKVLQEAAALDKKEIVEQLLFDGVHPDIRIEKGDETAFEKAVSEKVRRLLYDGGAKTEKPQSSLSWTLWQSIDCKPFDAKKPPSDGPIHSCVGNEEFRALVVEIYSPISFDANSKPTQGELGRPKEELGKTETKEAEKDEGSKERSAPNIVNYEYHRYAHPTVDDLIREGPDKIMGIRPKEFPPREFQRYRWIHLPMNHMTWLRNLIETICNQHCQRLDCPRKTDPTGRCDRICFQNFIDQKSKDKTKTPSEELFPFLPSFGDYIFEARYWVGQQDTPGTDEYSAANCLRPQFRRLGLAPPRKGNPDKLKRTGFAVIVPYIHFDTFENVRNLKEEVARLQIEARKRFLPPDCCFTPKTAAETGEEHDICEIQDVGPVPKFSMDAIRMHLFSSLPIHCRKTLSQYYYHLQLQKPKQTVTCHFEKQWPYEDPLVLMVDQLWMLVLVDGTILTCFPSQMAGLQREFPYIYTDIAEELLGELRSKWRSGISSQLDLGLMILKECMGFIFNQRRRYNKRFRLLNVYEQQLSDIAADEVACFDHLKKIVAKLPYPKTPDYESEAQNCMEELLKMEKEMKVMDKLDELKHIRRELHVISEVVEQQESVICQMFDNLKHGEFEMFQIGQEPHSMRLEKMERRRKRIEKLDQKAASIFNDIELSTRRKEQQVRYLQVYFSSQLNMRTLQGGTIVLVITLIAAIFAPLSFLTTFLALPVKEYPTEDRDRLPLSFVMKWLFSIGSTLIAIVVVPGMWYLGSFNEKLGKSIPDVIVYVRKYVHNFNTAIKKGLGRPLPADLSQPSSGSTSSTRLPGRGSSDNLDKIEKGL